MAEEKILNDEKVEEEGKESQQIPAKEEKKDLKKHKLESTNLDWVAYDEDAKVLYVCFKQGTVYSYDDVPKDVFEGLLNAGSHGRYFAVKIKWKYNYKKLA